MSDLTSPTTALLRCCWIHYCQICDDSILMAPDGVGRAVCPRCGAIQVGARLAPLFVVTGASGSGKSTIFPLVAERLGRHCMTFDADWLIDPLGGDVTKLDWRVLRDAWLHLAHGVAQNGLPTLLLSSFTPEQLDELPGRRWIRETHFLLLDVDDDERRRRIDARPAGRTHDTEPQVAFGAWLRTRVATRVDTTTADPADTAREVAAWAMGLLPPE